jgi:hypothetical protein
MSHEYKTKNISPNDIYLAKSAHDLGGITLKINKNNRG